MAKQHKSVSKQTTNAPVDASALEPAAPPVATQPETVAPPVPVPDNAPPVKAEAPVQAAQDKPEPNAKDKANDALTSTAELASAAQEALVSCIDAYKRGERNFREGMFTAGEKALAFVSLRVRIGATRESAVTAINGMLAAHSTTTPDANGLIRSWIAFRELSEGRKDLVLESIPYGHWANGWSMLVEGRAPVTGSGDRIYPEIAKDAAEFFDKALVNSLPRESVASRCSELLSLALKRRVEIEKQEAKRLQDERKAADEEKAKADKEAREGERKAEEAAKAKEAAEKKHEEAAKAALAAPAEGKGKAEEEAAKAKEAKEAADKEAADRKADAEKARREKELADQKAAQAKDEERKKNANLASAETAKARLEKQREKQEAKKGGTPPAKEAPAKRPESPSANLIGSAKDMRPDHFAKMVSDAIFASKEMPALITALLVHWYDSKNELGPVYIKAIGAALDVIEEETATAEEIAEEKAEKAA